MCTTGSFLQPNQQNTNFSTNPIRKAFFYCLNRDFICYMISESTIQGKLVVSRTIVDKNSLSFPIRSDTSDNVLIKVIELAEKPSSYSLS